MNLKQCYLTENNCYKSGKKHTVKGIMLHSTGANNPNLKRYVGPDDGLLGVNQYNNHWNTAKPDGVEVCVHAFIGKLKDGSIATYQTLPWDMVGWHSGSGSLGYAKNANNNGYIGFEICEDGLTDASYFNAVYKEAVELCVYLCNQYGLTEKNIICHSEGYKLGLASNHADVMHWFPKHGKNMDTFRADVKAGLTVTKKSVEPDNPADIEKLIWDTLYMQIGNAYGVAGLMGNLYAESALYPNNLQNAYEKKLGYTDKTYTAAVDNGSYTNFVKDSAGYGLAQWTFWSRKQALLEYARAAEKSIGDLQTQLGFLYKELSTNYTTTLAALKKASSVFAASTVVLTQYECPSDQSESVQQKRAAYGQSYYDKYAPKQPTPTKYYRVQVGAYSVKANADAMLSKVKAAGFTDAFIKYSE